MAGIKGLAGLTGFLLATVVATGALAAVPAEICRPATPAEAATPAVPTPIIPAAEIVVPVVPVPPAPVIPAAEVVAPADDKMAEDCASSSEMTPADDVCVFKPGMEQHKAPAPAPHQDPNSGQVSSNSRDGDGFVANLLRTAGNVWSAVVTTLDVVTRDARI
jgi:hypothetical protein